MILYYALDVLKAGLVPDHASAVFVGKGTDQVEASFLRYPPGSATLIRAAAADQRCAAGRGGRAGLPAARRQRGAAVAVDRAGTGRRARPERGGGDPFEHPARRYTAHSGAARRREA